MPSINDIRNRLEEVNAICTKHGASNLRIFGSTARGDETPQSDVDFLVDFERGRGVLQLMALEMELEQLLGAKVEVLTVGGLSPFLKDRILTEAIPV